MGFFQQPQPSFPCTAAFDDTVQLKLSGVYAQRQKGLWMQRIKIQGGVLEAEDWQTLADLARTAHPRHAPFDNNAPVH